MLHPESLQTCNMIYKTKAWLHGKPNPNQLVQQAQGNTQPWNYSEIIKAIRISIDPRLRPNGQKCMVTDSNLACKPGYVFHHVGYTYTP